MHQFIAFIASLFFLLTAYQLQAQPEIFEYNIRWYPATSETCPTIGRDIAARLAKDYQVEIYEVTCRALFSEENPKGFEIDIHYIADQQLQLQTTYDNRSFDSQATYRTKAQCEAGLAKEMKDFQTFTGLTPFLGYCYDTGERMLGVHYFWVSRIDSFGQAKVQPQTYVSGAVRPLKLQKEKIVAEILANASKAEIHTARAAVDNNLFGHRIIVGYYAEKPIAFDRNEVLQFPSLQYCQAHENEVRQIFSQANAPFITMYCAGGDNASDLQLFQIEGPQTIRIKNAEKSYATYQQCIGDRQNVLKIYRDVLKRDVIGGVCAPSAQSPFALYVLGRGKLKVMEE